MKNLRYRFLDKYFVDKTEENETFCKMVDEFFEPANRLYKINRISLTELDELVDAMSEYQRFLFKFIANCPFVVIKLDNQNDNCEVR